MSELEIHLRAILRDLLEARAASMNYRSEFAGKPSGLTGAIDLAITHTKYAIAEVVERDLNESERDATDETRD